VSEEFLPFSMNSCTHLLLMHITKINGYYLWNYGQTKFCVSCDRAQIWEGSSQGVILATTRRFNSTSITLGMHVLRWLDLEEEKQPFQQVI
jgi:hypothetical protein